MISRSCSQPRLRARAVMLLALGLLGLALLHAPAPALAGACPNESSPGYRSYLPECRAYELVSPAYKEGFSVEPQAISESGERVIINSFGNFAGNQNTSGFGQPYDLLRSGSEWGTTPLDSPFSKFSLYVLKAVSPDFQSSLWSMRTPAHPDIADVYRGPPGGPFTRVGPMAAPGVVGERLEFISASEDLSRAVYMIPSPNVGEGNPLWPGDTTADGRFPSLYEYAGIENEEPRLVGISDVGTPASIAASHLISDCGTSLGSFPEQSDAYNAVSADGAKVFFTAASGSSCGALGPLVNEVYARIDGSQTVPISEPSEADCSKCEIGPGSRADAVFAGASHDGSQVFFTTNQRLLLAASGAGPFLYRYNFNAPVGERVTLLSGGDPAGARVQGVARVSEDGSHVYFVAQGALTGANGEGKSPSPGGMNLYVSVSDCPEGGGSCADPTVRTAFVGTLSGADAGDWSTEDQRPVQATPDGGFLVFRSIADLTADQAGRQEAGQIFEYDAGNETLARVSRGQGGFNEDGNSAAYAATIPTQNYAGTAVDPRSIHLAVSADGARVFFSSKDALTPQALGGFNNVYEYHGGVVSLISDGQDVVSTFGSPAVLLIGTDESGLDVFFRTADRLAPQDTDNQTDLYDARVDGGPLPAVSSAPCEGDACQGAASVPASPPATAPVVGEAPAASVAGGSVTPKSKPPTNAQKLAKALRACTKKPKRQRAACRSRARKHFGLKAKPTAISHKGGK